jgi:hypothetical protein
MEEAREKAGLPPLWSVTLTPEEQRQKDRLDLAILRRTLEETRKMNQ